MGFHPVHVCHQLSPQFTLLQREGWFGVATQVKGEGCVQQLHPPQSTLPFLATHLRPAGQTAGSRPSLFLTSSSGPPPSLLLGYLSLLLPVYFTRLRQPLWGSAS